VSADQVIDPPPKVLVIPYATVRADAAWFGATRVAMGDDFMPAPNGVPIVRLRKPSDTNEARPKCLQQSWIESAGWSPVTKNRVLEFYMRPEPMHMWFNADLPVAEARSPRKFAGRGIACRHDPPVSPMSCSGLSQMTE